jgi:hypothetical protein
MCNQLHSIFRSESFSIASRPERRRLDAYHAGWKTRSHVQYLFCFFFDFFYFFCFFFASSTKLLLLSLLPQLLPKCFHQSPLSVTINSGTTSRIKSFKGSKSSKGGQGSPPQSNIRLFYSCFSRRSTFQTLETISSKLIPTFSPDLSFPLNSTHSGSTKETHRVG